MSGVIGKQQAESDVAPEPEAASEPDVVLDVQGLVTSFSSEEGELRAVDGVSFQLRRGRTLAVVGESGCGKSVTAHSLLRLINRPGRVVSGSARFWVHDRYVDVLALREDAPELFAVRGGAAAMIFQEALAALSPVHTVGQQIAEAVLTHRDVGTEQARALSIAMLQKVGISQPELRFTQYPHELSGGMRQRVVIAMALVTRPLVLIADEPTTALDVTIQAQVLALLKALQRELGTAILLITHDLGVVAHSADDVVVMYLGRVVERGPVRTLLKAPRHPYTQGLLRSLPGRGGKQRRLPSIEGYVPPLSAVPTGCPFHPRCAHSLAGRCDTGPAPELTQLTENHAVACVRVHELSAHELSAHGVLAHGVNEPAASKPVVPNDGAQDP